jgi:hypothetical protein
MMLWSCYAPAWDGPSTRSYLAGLFFGGILWVFHQAHDKGGRQCWCLCDEGRQALNTRV